MLQVDIQRFLTTGSLGDVRVGSLRDEVVRALGEPTRREENHVEKYADRDLWTYWECIQVDFRGDRVSRLVWVNSRYAQSVSGLQQVNLGLLPLDLSAFADFLERSGIPFVESFDLAGKKLLTTPEGVVAKFSRHVDREASKAAGRPVISEVEPLVMVSIGNNE